MPLALKRASLAPSVQKVRRIIGGFPDSYCFTLSVLVHGSDELAQAMKNGAPNTSEAAWGHFTRMHEEFKPNFSGHARKEVLLVCFGAFVKQSLFEDFAAQVMAREKLSHMRLRTMLAIGSHYRDLCQTRSARRMRFVSLARKVRHLNLWHVPTLHQEDRTDCVTNALKLEPYDFGWSAEHIFGFEGDAR